MCLAVSRLSNPGPWFFSEFQWEPAAVFMAFNMDDTVGDVRQQYHDTVTSKATQAISKAVKT